jgi:ABC-type transport system involved in multi-copper enzyme maturation permease subunit
MNALLRVAQAELRRLSSPGFLWAAIGLPMFFAGLTTFLTFSSANGSSTGGPPGGEKITVATLNGATGYLEGITQAFTFLGVIAVVVAALSIATDYSQGTMRNLLVRQPSRWRVLGGKLIALSVVLTVSALAASLVGTAVAYLMASGSGVSTGAWTITSLVPRVAELSVGLIGWAAIGALLATVLRSVAPAIGIAIGWALPVETIIGATWKTGKAWFPGGVFQSIASAGTSTVTFGRAVIVGSLYLAVAVIAAITVFQRREVTA